MGLLGDLHITFDQRRVDVQDQSPRLVLTQSPDPQPHPDLGQTMDVSSPELAGQVGDGIGPGNARHSHQTQQPRVGPQNIDIVESVATLDDHLQKRQDLGRHRITPTPLFKMRECPVEFLPQTDILGEGHEQSQT